MTAPRINELPVEQRPYPSKYRPGIFWALDEAWEILDTLPVDMLPDNYRFFMAGQIAGSLVRAEQRAKWNWRNWPLTPRKIIKAIDRKIQTWRYASGR